MVCLLRFREQLIYQKTFQPIKLGRVLQDSDTFTICYSDFSAVSKDLKRKA